MRRLFIIRADLHLSAGKLSAMIGHCCEAYWTNLLKSSWRQAKNAGVACGSDGHIHMPVSIKEDVWDGYVNGIFIKTVCEARNRNHLMKAADKATEMGLVEGDDWGIINDCCLTELTPENEDDTTTIGIWFAPLPDEVAHGISKKYPLLREHNRGESSR